MLEEVVFLAETGVLQAVLEDPVERVENQAALEVEADEEVEVNQAVEVGVVGTNSEQLEAPKEALQRQSIYNWVCTRFCRRLFRHRVRNCQSVEKPSCWHPFLAYRSVRLGVVWQGTLHLIHGSRKCRLALQARSRQT